ncbi:stalk domain-containing protein [Paenibacillus plantarum]|uniref:stalk domain-containing protein n=1 Tax=Paenibacillus plantarum TaxID=2654975 RepID=UPI001490BEEE|nr:stalk domain-containing protein [Paenibacillus plantarum]
MKKVIAALILGLLIGSATTSLADSSDSVQAVFAKFNFVVNGEKKEIKTTPLVVEGTSYLPVREVSSLLGYELGYDDATRTIKLEQKQTVGGKPLPDNNINYNDNSEWISVTELAKLVKVSFRADPPELTIQKGDNVKKYLYPDPNVVISNGSTFIKINSLKEFGLID